MDAACAAPLEHPSKSSKETDRATLRPAPAYATALASSRKLPPSVDSDNWTFLVNRGNHAGAVLLEIVPMAAAVIDKGELVMTANAQPRQKSVIDKLMRSIPKLIVDSIAP